MDSAQRRPSEQTSKQSKEGILIINYDFANIRPIFSQHRYLPLELEAKKKMETTTFGVDRTSREQRRFGGQTKYCHSTSLGIMTVVPVIVTFMAAIFALSVGGGGNSQISDTTVSDPSSMLETRRLAGGDYGNKAKEEYAVIFPVFILVIGVAMHYVLGRVAHHVFPYTVSIQIRFQFSLSIRTSPLLFMLSYLIYF